MSDMSSLANIMTGLRDKYGMPEKVDLDELKKLRIASYNADSGTLNEEDGYNCELCKNKGFIAEISESGEEVYVVCKCRKIRNTLRRAKRSGLGDILTDFTFDKYKDTEDWQKFIKSKAQAFCTDEEAKWFFIGGQVGSGKSHICTAIAAHYIKAGREVKYMVWAEEAKKLKALVNDISYQDEMEIYREVDVLYIDDFLKVQNGENPTKADINLAFEIINRRLLSRDKITIISTEKTLDELMDYDEATMSRIYVKTGDYKINIGKDRSRNYRLKGAATI